MFIGHFGLGFAAKKPASGISLGLLFLAAQFLDLLWPILLIFNLEHVVIAKKPGSITPLDFIYYPWSHSLLMVLLWSSLFALVYWLFTKNSRYAVILGGLVLSHWFLDLIVHEPDLPLYAGDSPHLGMGLWRSMIATILIESLIFIGGLILYLKSTKPKNMKGSIALWLIVVLLVVSHIGNLFGPPPPSVKMIAWAGNLQWLFVLLAFWADRNRTTVKKEINMVKIEQDHALG